MAQKKTPLLNKHIKWRNLKNNICPFLTVLSITTHDDTCVISTISYGAGVLGYINSSNVAGGGGGEKKIALRFECGP